MSCSEACGKSDVPEDKVGISNLSRVKPQEALETMWSAILFLWNPFWNCRRSSLPGWLCSSDLAVTALPTTWATWVRETLSGLWKSRCEIPGVSQHESTSCLMRWSSEIQKEVDWCLMIAPLEHGNDAATEFHGKRHWGAGGRANSFEIWNIHGQIDGSVRTFPMVCVHSRQTAPAAGE